MSRDPWDRVALGGTAYLSAVEDAVSNPLWAALEAIPAPQARTVGDLGCGPGGLLPYLARRFGKVVGLDRSKPMLARARERLTGLAAGHRERVELLHGSLARLSGLRGRLDVCITLNSVIMPEPGEVRRALGGIRRCLRPGGVYLAVFPALESARETWSWAFERQLRAGSGIREARARTARILRAGRVDFALGLVDAGLIVQRHHTRYELEQGLGRAGFREVEFGQVRYGTGVRWPGVDRIGGRPPAVWHWFLRAG